MKFAHRIISIAALAIASTFGPLAVSAAHARSAAQIAAEGQSTLHKLEAREPRSRMFARQAKGILVFPSIFKAGVVFGGESGNGVLLIHGRPAGFYNLSGGTWGMQIGGEKFSMWCSS